jgi:hypothetical protein
MKNRNTSRRQCGAILKNNMLLIFHFAVKHPRKGQKNCGCTRRALL